MAFKDNVWWTRKARIQAEKRLLSNAFQSQLLMLWYSFFGVAVSIYYLKIDNSVSHNDLPGISWVVYSVLTLCMSGFITGLSFKERAGLIKECYEALSTFYQMANAENADINLLSKEYERILGLCENHTDCDYYLALCIEYATSIDDKDQKTNLKKGLDRMPTWYHWFSITYWIFRRYLLLTFLYFLPVLLFFGLESIK